MSREELIETMVTAVMEEFDFDRVHRAMVNLDWKLDFCVFQGNKYLILRKVTWFIQKKIR